MVIFGPVSRSQREPDEDLDDCFLLLPDFFAPFFGEDEFCESENFCTLDVFDFFAIDC